MLFNQVFWNFPTAKTIRLSLEKNSISFAKLSAQTRVMLVNKFGKSVKIDHIWHQLRAVAFQPLPLTYRMMLQVMMQPKCVIRKSRKLVSHNAAGVQKGEAHFPSLQVGDEAQVDFPSNPTWNECSTKHDHWKGSFPERWYPLQLHKSVIFKMPN